MKQLFCITAAKLLGLLTALALVFCASLPVHAATTWTVTKTADTDDGVCDNDCSLREAIAAAASGDTILFDSLLSGGTIAVGGTLTLSQDVTIDGSALVAPISIDGVNAYRVFYVNAGVTATLNSLTIAHGRADFGGGIYNQGALTVTNSLFYGNSAPGAGHYGGGIFNAWSSTLIVRSSTFSGNSTGDRGGGIYNEAGTLTVADSAFTGNSAAVTGGIYNWVGTMTLSNSTFIGNIAFDCGGVVNNAATMTMSNCTFSGNSAIGSDYFPGTGGGLCTSGRGTVLNSTFSDNRAAATGGGIAYYQHYWFSTLTLVNTIIANSTAGGDCYEFGTIDTNLNNLVEDGSCSSNGVNFKTGDPGLGPLADNGGPTQTFALLPNSLAINAGDNATCAAAPVSGKDQRGKPRNDTQCDIGAFELEPNRPPVAEANGPYTVAEGSSVTLDGTGSHDPDDDPFTYAWDLDNDGTLETSGATPSFAGTDGPSTHTVVLRVCDPDNACADDATTVTVDNVAPTVNAGPDQTVYRNDVITLGCTWTDPAGAADNPYSYAWDVTGDGAADLSGTASYGAALPATTSFATPGVYTLTCWVTDEDNVTGSDRVQVDVLNRAPVCAAAVPSPATIWPPNNKFVPINVLGVTDPDGDPLTIKITSIYQDEPVDTAGDGKFVPDGQGLGSSTAEVRAERAGTPKVPGNGRFYHISFTAADPYGYACSVTVKVSVPHDQAKPPVDGGPLYDSTVP